MTLTKLSMQLIVKEQISSIWTSFHSPIYNIDQLHTLLGEININFHLIGITENRLKKDTTRTSNIDIKGYTFEHTPTETSSSGSLLYIKDTLKHICRKDLQIYKAAELESTFIELLSSSGKNTIVGCIYRHPSMHSSEFNRIYQMTFLKSSHTTLLIS